MINIGKRLIYEKRKFIALIAVVFLTKRMASKTLYKNIAVTIAITFG
jgi:hypothetical protein